MAVTLNDWMVYGPVILVIIIAIMGYLATRSAVAKDGWYQYINKAPFTPPNWVFGVVWLFIYIFIAWIWARANYTIKDEKLYLYINWLFVVNIVLNLAWSFYFFSDGNFVYALIILLLMIVSVIFIIYYLRYDWLSVTLMSIYLVWLLFALYLNWYALRNNNIVITM